MFRPRPAYAALLLPIAFAAVACSAGGSGPSTAPPPASSAPAQSTPAQSTAPTETAVATTLDPCQVVTAAEAGALAGTTFGAGLEETTGDDDKGKRCTYGAGTTSVFFVQLGQSPDAASAQTAWDAEVAQAQAVIAGQLPPGATVGQTGDLDGLADKAAVATGSQTVGGQTIGATTLFLIKGATFLAFGDLALGQAPPAVAAMEAQARVSIARLP